MFNEEIRKMNVLTKTLFDRYCAIADEKTALIMACVDGKQPEICEFILQQERQNQEILMRETLSYLVPREELYPSTQYTSTQFALDDFLDEKEETQQ